MAEQEGIEEDLFADLYVISSHLDIFPCLLTFQLRCG